MLRRVVQASRLCCLMLGVLFLGLLVGGLFYIPSITFPRPFPGVVVSATDGAIVILSANAWSVTSQPSHYGARDDDSNGEFEIRLTRDNRTANRSLSVLPHFEHRTVKHWMYPQGVPMFSLWFPLWLLAFLCLAWPVTSFLLARRRRGRGFAVEPLSMPAAAGAESARR